MVMEGKSDSGALKFSLMKTLFMKEGMADCYMLLRGRKDDCGGKIWLSWGTREKVKHWRE